MHPFRKVFEERDLGAIEALLAESVVFTSPVATKPYPGKAMTAAILRGSMRVFEDFRFVRELAGPDGRDLAFAFAATVNGTDLTGCDFLHFDDEGLIDDVTIMVRPLAGANALAQAMADQFEQIKREALGG